jgi:RPA family protein
MEDKKDFSRQPAMKVTIGTLLFCNYIEQNDADPNYLELSSGERLYRLNLMAVILDKENVGAITNLLADDGTGKIVLRSFEENKNIESLSVGDSVLVIGKLRKYNQEKYVSPEIIKKINPEWLKLRSLELMDNIETNSINGEDQDIKQNNGSKDNRLEEEPKKIELKKDQGFSEELVKNKEKIEEIPKQVEDLPDADDEEMIESPLLPVEKLIQIIKEMDSGEGVMIEEIISNSQIKDTEELLGKMLEKGDIFQNSPGKVKVL